jgi:uncharacterized membrane protein YcaP (DUF421 family)
MDRLADLFSLTLPPWEIMLRGTVLYLALFLLFRFVARRNFTPLGITDLLLVVLIADASQNAMAGEYKSISDGLLLVATLSFWDLLIDWLSFRFPRFARFAEPPPLLLIRDGTILHRNLRREFITREELQAKLRGEGLENADEVKRAFLESSGEITVIKRAKDQP